MDHRDYRLARELEPDAMWAQYFNRLIALDPPEILISDDTRFEPCAIWSGKECDCGIPADFPKDCHWKGDVVWTDINFWIPCDEHAHAQCGFFEWTLCLHTIAYRSAREAEGEEYGPSWDSVDVNASLIRETDLPCIVTTWLTAWVEPLAHKPVRLLSYEESRQIWARYEEMHPNPESRDILQICAQRIVAIENGTAELIPLDELEQSLYDLATESDDEEDLD